MNDTRNIDTSRRGLLKAAALCGVGMSIGKFVGPSPAVAQATTASASPSTDASAAQLRWLDDASPPVPSGVAFGVPWARGTIPGNRVFHLQTPDGKSLPTQSWPLAYWPDGSLKWTGLAIAGDPSLPGPFTVVSDAAPSPATPITVQDSPDTLEIATGTFRCTIPRAGSHFIRSLSIDGREVGTDARLLAIREDRSEEAAGTTRLQNFTSVIQKVTVEQSGPVRAVVRIEGMHGASNASRQWLPFNLRLYFTAGVNSFRIVHSFVFDGDAHTDFLRGLGLAFTVPFREEKQNRHIRFAGDGEGVWGEPVLMAPGYREALVKGAKAMNKAQLEGTRISNLDALGAVNKAAFESVPLWDGFKLMQLAPDSFSLKKRTGTPSSWLQIANGHRARGTAFIGDVSGGLALGVKNFWQKYPSALEINGAASSAADLTVWFWSPDAPAMDLRHYDTIGHDGRITYEDYTEGFSTPTGVANTNELTVWACAETPHNAALATLAKTASEPPLLVCQPEYYHATKTLGVWALRDKSTADTAAVEDTLDKVWDFYHAEVDRRHWYGFWDFGDVMRTYDDTRHTWMYDIGGHAWNNTELMPDAWLWYTFLRTGAADAFRFAEAMTRNTQEVDVYHLGQFVGLGSRHNVSHWGCGAKECRISASFLKRFYYYLTTDERTGDLMRENLDVDKTVVRIQPLRKQVTRGDTPIVRIGPDWLTFASNWMTEWERTGNTKFRDQVLTGMKCIGAMPEQFVSLQAYRYDPATNELFDIGKPNNPTTEFIDLFGGDQVAMDLIALIPCPEFEQAWNKLCTAWATDPKWKGYTKMRMCGYVANLKQDAALKAQAWNLLKASVQQPNQLPVSLSTVVPPLVPAPVEEHAGMNTPGTAQWALNMLMTMEFAREFSSTPKA